MCVRETETDTKTEREQGIHFDDIIHTIVETSKSEICKAGWQAGNSGKS